MQVTTLTPEQQAQVREQVAAFLGKSSAFNTLALDKRDQVLADTEKIVAAMAEGQGSPDPYSGLARGQGNTTASGGGVSTSTTANVGDKIEGGASRMMQQQLAPTGSIIDVGVQEAAKMIREIDFPAFVSKLIEGTFHAIVKASIEQMRAYAEMVRSVSTSLNDFRDRNTTENQAMDHLASLYPNLMQVEVRDGQPLVTVKDGADTDNLPNFQKDLGLNEPVTDIDDETIQSKLVPAARDDLARGRQQLLATIILLGINRIVVTDGRINAKIRFNFSARESRQVKASAFDYGYVGEKATSTRTAKNLAGDGGDQGAAPTDKLDQQQQYQLAMEQVRNRYAIGYDEQSSIEPDVRVTSEFDLTQQGNIQAAGQIMGEVSVNFKSDVFPLEKIVDTDQIQKLTQAQGAGRGAPPPPAPGATPAGSSSGPVIAPPQQSTPPPPPPLH
jgi:hypothetical protein